MKVQFSPVDPIAMIVAMYLAYSISSWWLVVPPLIVAGWFIEPRWNNVDGFKFWR